MPTINELTRIEPVHLDRLARQGIFTTGLLLEVSETSTRRQTLADQAREDVNAATCGVVAAAVAIGRITTAQEGVGGDAKRVDRRTQDEVSVELVVFAARAVERVVDIDTDVTIEEVGEAHAAAKSVFVIEDGSSKHVNG